MTASQGSASAYLEANRLHAEEQTALAVLNYDTEPAWDPRKYAQPLLSPEQLAARATILEGLQQYATLLAALGAGAKDANLATASTGLAAGLQSLSQSIATSFAATVTGAPSLSDSQTATLGSALNRLSEVLRQRIVQQRLPGVLVQHDGDIAAICEVLVSDAAVLRSQADRDYTTLEEAQDHYVRSSAASLPRAERNAAIARLPEMVRAQQQNDALLAQLQNVLRNLASAHHALAGSAKQKGLDAVTVAQVQGFAAQAQTLLLFARTASQTPLQ